MIRSTALVLALSLTGCHLVLDPGDYTDENTDGGADATSTDGGDSTRMIRVSVESGADDALQDPGGVMNIAYAWISLYSDDHWGAVRFRIPDITRGATIERAYLELLIDSDAEDDPDVVVYIEPTPNPLPLTTSPYDISERARSAASVMWIDTGIGAGIVQSPSLISLVQEAVDHASWTAGSYILFIFDARQLSGIFEFWQHENGNGASPAELVIRYTPN